MHEIISPYRIPLFRALASEPSLDLTVVHLARTEPRRDWALDFHELPYPCRRVRAAPVPHRDSVALVPWGLSRALDDLAADVVIVPGFGTPASLAALGWARRRRLPLVMWSEGAMHRSSPKVETLKRALVGTCQGFVVPGEMARDHLVELGAAAANIAIAPNCIDLELFRPAPAGSHASVRSLAMCARLHPGKGVDVAIEALDLADPDRSLDLTVIGAGPDRASLEALAVQRGVRVRFAGSVQYEEVAGLLRAADAFLFPTRRDVWGFALQEAAASGLPMISSVYAGATRELLVDGETGWAVLSEPRSVAGAIRRLAALPADELRAMSLAARRAAERLSVEAAVAGFRAAIGRAVAGPATP